MRIPQKIEYACRVLVQLAGAGGEVSRVDELAAKEDVSSSYLLQILNDLRHEGLVESRRGKNGGYLLSRKPEDISLYDVVLAIEGAVLEPSGASSGESGEVVTKAWKSVSEDLEKTLRTWTLERMAQDDDVQTWVI